MSGVSPTDAIEMDFAVDWCQFDAKVNRLTFTCMARMALLRPFLMRMSTNWKLVMESCTPKVILCIPW